ncbi:MAG: segregation/condensation protein A [Alphaproteobacteria bacterium]|nr:segregation/condensation protein A [Alphaproteobacteria bacterium]
MSKGPALETPFEEDNPDRIPQVHIGAQLVLDLDGFEGPIDVLLSLARDQKVDIAKISILELAEQYLVFVREAQRLNLELAADYLVMAAWLAFMKSRLLLPEPESDDQPTGAELAARLQFQLQRLDAMREAGKKLIDRPRLGRDVFVRGAPEEFRAETTAVLDVKLFDVLKAYGEFKLRSEKEPLKIFATRLYSVEAALERLRPLIGETVEWTQLESFLPQGLGDPVLTRSAIAAHFTASLELVRDGIAEISQSGQYQPLLIRKKPR